MKFSELPQGYFVVISPDKSSLLLAKDTKGKIRSGTGYVIIEDHNITQDTEVQEVHLKENR